MLIWPHGLDVDREGNVWVTEAAATNRIPKGDKRGHIVVKFSAAGKVQKSRRCASCATPATPKM